MNNKYVYIPISFLVLLSIVLVSLEIPNFGLMLGFKVLFFIAFISSLLVGVLMYLRYHKYLQGEYLIATIGASILMSFVVILAIISILNRKYATIDCEVASYKVVSYKGRYAAGYGNLKKGEIKANQWILKVSIDGLVEQFILEKDISRTKAVTTSVPLEFCKGIYGTKYLKIN